MKSSKALIIAVPLLLLLGFTLIGREEEPEPLEVNIKEYDIYELDYMERPYTTEENQAVEIDYDVDEDDVPLFTYRRTGEQHHHPVSIAQKALAWIDGYVQTGNGEYLERAERYSAKIYEDRVEVEDYILFPYTFDFPLHGIEEATMEAPWYSAMAQGQVLSLFTRMYEATGDDLYRRKAEETFNSLRVPSENLLEDWVVIVDEEGYLWLEEYPLDHLENHGSQALNGFIFAIYGLYDYYLLTEEEEVKELLQASITTIERYIEDFRAEGEISYYSLAHYVQSGRYHTIHIDQLEMLYKITGESYFKEMAELFREDHMEEEAAE